MNKRQRLDKVFAGEAPDRTPILGGWIACPQHICSLAGKSLEQYWQNPVEISVEAYRQLGMDGLIDIYVPNNHDDFRCVDHNSYLRAQTGLSLEDTLAQIESWPDAAEVEQNFNFEESYAAFRQSLVKRQKLCGDMVYMPAQWGAGAKVSWYADIGYEFFFLIIGLYPDHARKLMETGGATGRCHSRLIARAVGEGIYPRAVLLGEDICTQRGPMVSPQFLEKYYAPQLRYGLEPLLEAGCKPVWHCDGDVRPLLDLLLDSGVQGFQGFQPECGMTLDYVVGKRTRDKQKLLIFGPLSVTTELPCLSPEQIRQKVWQAIDICRDKADLVLFTANTINPDIPLENIQAMAQAVQRQEH
jgi:hypothetical protein